MRVNLFQEIYERLFAYYGPQKWWPGETAFEVVVGAVVTQNTNWLNVTKAINNLRQRGLLSFSRLYSAPLAEVAECLRPSGYFNIKARRLHGLLKMIAERYNGNLEDLFSDNTHTARANLLSVKGVGPESADAILLYGGHHPVFVVDAYTHRVFSRHKLVAEECSYDELQEAFTTRLPQDWQLYNEYHALIVRVGKEFCKKGTPLCENCPLKGVEE